MGGGLMQLVAYGAQDIYLTGNPQITFFKVVYRRHTNFSMEAISQTWNGPSTGNAAGRCTATISRNGDLVGRMYLEVTGQCATNEYNPSAQAITSLELEIGGQKIDKHTGQWMNVWSHLTEPNPTGATGDVINSTGTAFQNMSGMGGVDSHGSNAGNVRLFIPLQFWFCRNPGLALPLIALQYHEVKVVFEHDFTKSFSAGATANTLWADYIYLDTDERRRFAQVTHEYLIEQVQHEEFSATTTMTLNFNHPVKELIWTGIRNDAATAKAVNRSNTTVDSLYALSTLGSTDYQLKLNGHDRFAGRDVKYFTRTQVWQHHTGYGATGTKDRIGVYSFALKPEEHQPSGTCNFSRIDNAQLTGGSAARHVYAVNYNVLRIMSGMGGLAYSN